MGATWMLCAWALGGASLINGGFEAKPTGAATPPGWVVEIGARNGAERPESGLELDRREKHSGKASLHLSGDGSTRAWRILEQDVEVRPGGTYTLSAWTRARAVHPNGFGLDNAYLGLMLFDAEDKLVGRQLGCLRQERVQCDEFHWTSARGDGLERVQPGNQREAEAG